MDKRKIIFRADGGPVIGMGHFIRTLALVEMLRDDFYCIYATQSPSDYQIVEIEKVCHKRFDLPADETHFDIFLSFLKGDEIVVLDNYYFTTEYQQQIRNKGCKLVCIDDMHDKHYVADLVINIGVEECSLFSAEIYTQFCLGLNWALLRTPFIKASEIDSKSTSTLINRVVLSFGGSDQYHFTTKMICLLSDFKQISRIDAIVGDSYVDTKNYSQKSGVFFHKNITSQEIASLFLQCDLAILSSSTICVEALACSAKVAAGYYIDNQKDFYSYLSTFGYIYGLGNLNAGDYKERIQNLLNNNQIELKPLKLNMSSLPGRIRDIFDRL